MADGFEWVAELKDQISGPTEEIRKSLGNLKTQLASTDAATGTFSKGISEGAKESKESIFGAVLSAELWVEAIKKVGEVALEAAKMLGEFTLEGAKMALEAREFKDDMTDAYAAFRGSAEEGESTYKMVDSLAKSLPIPARQAHEMAKDLMVQGLENQQQIASTIQAVAALSQVQGEAAGGKLQNIINRSLASGKFQIKTKELTAVGGQALQGFYAKLSSQLGVSEKEVKARLLKGNIDVSQGINAITDTINSGKIGELSAKQMGDFSVQAKKAKDSLMRLFDSVDTSKFLDALRQLGSIFDENTASGRALKAMITTVFGGVFDGAATATESVTILFLEIELGGLKALNALTPVIQTFQKIDKVVPVWQTLWDILKGIADTVTHIVLPKGIVDASVGGLSAGLQAAGGDVKGAAKTLGGGLLDGVKDVLGIHSPSREMAKLGKQTSAGFAMGVEQGGGGVDSAVGSLTKTPDIEAPSGVGSSKTFSVNVGGVSIQGVKGVEEMGPQLESWFADLLERVALEAGG